MFLVLPGFGFIPYPSFRQKPEMASREQVDKVMTFNEGPASFGPSSSFLVLM